MWIMLIILYSFPQIILEGWIMIASLFQLHLLPRPIRSKHGGPRTEQPVLVSPATRARPGSRAATNRRWVCGGTPEEPRCSSQVGRATYCGCSTYGSNLVLCGSTMTYPSALNPV